MIRSLLLIALALLGVGPVVAGPFPPHVGQPGSTAIAASDPAFKAWARRVVNYSPGTDLTPQWMTPERALGPPSTSLDHVVSLGAGGSLTLAFDGVIVDGPGPDFAVFENGFGHYFIECAFVEVSADGVTFVRFPGESLGSTPVPGFGIMDPTEVKGLGSKYRAGHGEPYDLSEVGLSQVSHVRLVDIIGDGSSLDAAGRPIFDPHPVAQSAGFDVDAVGALHFRQWFMLPAGTLSASAVNATALAHLPDGRLLLGRQGVALLQDAFGQSSFTPLATNGVDFDPAFIAVRDSSTVILGAGGDFSGLTGLHQLSSTSGVNPAPLAQLQNFSGAYWKSPTSALEGWLIGGTNHPTTGGHDVHFVSIDGSHAGPITDEISVFSAGIATDAAGNLYAATYQPPPFGSPGESNRVFRFSAPQIEAAVTAVLAQTPAPLPLAAAQALFQFDGASSLTVDGWGRIWATGFTTQQIQVFDPLTGANARYTPDHDPLPGVSDPIYQVNAFTRSGEPQLGLLVKEESGAAGTPIQVGTAPLSAFRPPVLASQWQQTRFGSSASMAGLEPSLWGENADPDADGHPNVLERALGLDPLHPDPPAVHLAVSHDRVEARLTLDPDAAGITLVVESASTLGPAGWTPLAQIHLGEVTPLLAGTLVTAASDGRLIHCRVIDPTPLTGLSARFLRLRLLSTP